MSTLPITGLEELEAHLDELVNDVTIPLNAKLFDHVELQLTQANIPPLIPRFLPRLTTILMQYPEDPAVLASLSIKLLEPVPFTQILTLANEEALILALRSPAPSANLLAMAVLEKAARSPADSAILAGMPDLVAAFLRTWLVSPDVGVGEKGRKVLADLLTTDNDRPLPIESTPSTRRPQQPQGEGKLWRRLLHDRDIYTLITSICAGRDADTADDDGRQLSLAQARLLRVIPHMAALNFQAVSQAEFSSPTPIHRTNGHAGDIPTKTSLLHFAALNMVNKRDRLMHLTLVDFFEVLLLRMSPRHSEQSPYKREVMRSLVREATARDAILREALETFPSRVEEEESEALREWLREVLPEGAVRIG